MTGVSDKALHDAALRLTAATDPTDYFGCEDDIRLIANAVLLRPKGPYICDGPCLLKEGRQCRRNG